MNSKIVITLFIILGFLAHGNTLANELFWDDDDNIVKNIYIKDFKYLPQLFTRSQIEGSFGQVSNQYRPFLMLTFSLEHHLWGLWAAGYHLTNVLLHIGNSILVFFFIRLLFELGIRNYELGKSSHFPLRTSHFGQTAAILTALFFLLHPVQTEAVAYVAGRTDLLPTFFMLVGLLVFLKSRIKKPELRIMERTQKFHSMIHDSKFIILAYILALLSKETAIVFPALLFLTDYFFLSHSLLKTIKQHLHLWMRLVLIAITYFFLRLTILNFQNTLNIYQTENVFTSNILYRLFTFFHALTIYTQLLMAPIHLHAERVIPIAKTLFEPTTLVGFMIFLLSIFLITYTTYKSSKTYKPYFIVVSYGLLWFWLTIFLTTNIPVPINSLLAEHFLYTPSLGVFFIVSMLILSFYSFLKRKIGDRTNLASALVIIPLLTLFSFYIARSISRNREWRDPITFYEQTLRYTPSSARVRNNLAMNYADRGNHPKAIEEYRLAIKTRDEYPQTHYNLGNSLATLGQNEEAIQEYLRSLQLDPNFLPSYGKLISLYVKEKQLAEATTLVNILKRRGIISDSEAELLLAP